MIPKILQRYADRALPRYTSYPTSPHFGAQIGADEYRDWLRANDPDDSVSLYLHVPFCRSMCWYCGCHTTITARDEPIGRYLDSLRSEIDAVAELLPARMRAQHVHFGGGTPTLMGPARFTAFMKAVRAHFDLEPDCEVAIEIDPRTLDPEMANALAGGGVTRASLGVQSFDPRVQAAINRIQSFEQTEAVVKGLRDAGIGAINFDLVYGLPHQDVRSCRETVATALRLKPDRLAVFGYAHVPNFKLHQRKIDEAELADGQERHAQAEAIAGALTEAGYRRIGLDHFATPDDPLALALDSGRLHRNFQGYTTDECNLLLGFGASSIGRLRGGHVQNAVLIGDYQRRVASSGIAVTKGCAFSGDDRLRGAIIERIMCDFEVDLASLCARYGAKPESLALGTRLAQLIDDGLVEHRDTRLALHPEARSLVRAFAAAFDDYLEEGPARHSRAV